MRAGEVRIWFDLLIDSLKAIGETFVEEEKIAECRVVLVKSCTLIGLP